MKSLKYLYITALLSSGASLFAQGEVVLPEETETGSAALVINGAVHDQYNLFPSEYDSEALKAVPVYLLKMDASKQLLRLKGEYKKGLNNATHHMVALFNHDANKAIGAFMNLDAFVQSEILLCAGQEFIKNYFIAINNFNAPTKAWNCVTKKERYGSYAYTGHWDEIERTEMSGPEDNCEDNFGPYDHKKREIEEGLIYPRKKIFSWIGNLGRYDFAQFNDEVNPGILATIDMLFRHAEGKDTPSKSQDERIEEMATYLAEIFNNLWNDEEETDSEDDTDSEEEAVPTLEEILIGGNWGSSHLVGKNTDRKLSVDECKDIQKNQDEAWSWKKEEYEAKWSENGCDLPVNMEVAATLQLNYLHALIRELDNANSIPLMERINEKGGLQSVLNNEICLGAEEDYFPFIEEELLGEMFEICEKYMYADEIIEALQNEGQYLAIGN